MRIDHGSEVKPDNFFDFVHCCRFRALGIDRAVENAELQDKLEKAQNELRRAQVKLSLLVVILRECSRIGPSG